MRFEEQGSRFVERTGGKKGRGDPKEMGILESTEERGVGVGGSWGKDFEE